MVSTYEDLILRRIRAFAAALARIMGLRGAGQLEETRLELDHEYQSILGDQHDVLRAVEAFSQFVAELAKDVDAGPLAISSPGAR